MDKISRDANVMHEALKWIVTNPGSHPANIFWVAKNALEKVDGEHGTTD